MDRQQCVGYCEQFHYGFFGQPEKWWFETEDIEKAFNEGKKSWFDKIDEEILQIKPEVNSMFDSMKDW